MNKIMIALIAIAFTSCNNAETGGSVSIMLPPEGSSGHSAVKEITDPVCGMVKDSTWTDFTIYNGDTVWFCAATEKTAFEGNPKKYEHNLRKHQ